MEPNEERTQLLPVVRVRALRWPVLASPTVVVQVVGGVAAVVGVYLAYGLARTLIVSGVLSVVLAALREAKRI